MLGPVLFLILMSDITEGINCNIVSFADDTRLYSAINSVTDCDDLQADLENIYKWADTNNMKFNSKKFQYINFGIHPEDKDSNVYVGPDLNLINASKTVKDLGVTMSNDCMFDQHIHNVKRSSQLCGWILRTFQTRSALLILTLFKSIVLSRIDYGSQLWSPNKKGYICELERIQVTTIIYKVYFWDAKFISSETECSEIVLSAKKKRQIYCNLYVEDFGKSSAKSANRYF